MSLRRAHIRIRNLLIDEDECSVEDCTKAIRIASEARDKYKFDLSETALLAWPMMELNRALGFTYDNSAIELAKKSVVQECEKRVAPPKYPEFYIDFEKTSEDLKQITCEYSTEHDMAWEAIQEGINDLNRAAYSAEKSIVELGAGMRRRIDEMVNHLEDYQEYADESGWQSHDQWWERVAGWRKFSQLFEKYEMTYESASFPADGHVYDIPEHPDDTEFKVAFRENSKIPTPPENVFERPKT